MARRASASPGVSASHTPPSDACCARRTTRPEAPVPRDTRRATDAVASSDGPESTNRRDGRGLQRPADAPHGGDRGGPVPGHPRRWLNRAGGPPQRCTRLAHDTGRGRATRCALVSTLALSFTRYALRQFVARSVESEHGLRIEPHTAPRCGIQTDPARRSTIRPRSAPSPGLQAPDPVCRPAIAQ